MTFSLQKEKCSCLFVGQGKRQFLNDLSFPGGVTIGVGMGEGNNGARRL